MITNLNQEQKETLLTFYNYLYKTGYPHQWRESIIIPIPKPNKNLTSPSSYRPIALTNCLSKIMEKMVNRRLLHLLEEKRFFSPHQSGFRAGHSVTDALCRLEYAARNAILHREYCVTVLLDINKAFDTVWHHGLFVKLERLGLSGNLTRFIREFLLARRIIVRNTNSLSAPFPVLAGVPQGSVLSPTLFNIMINDLFEEIPSGVHYSLYADDGALWTSSPDLRVALDKMQLALDSISKWSHIWGLSISPTKTNAIIFTNRATNSPQNLLLLSSPVNYVQSIKYLGMTFDSKLTWNRHIAGLQARCLKDLNLLKIISFSRDSSDYHILKRLYSSLILPKLDYGCTLFASAAYSHLVKLDRIQYAACRAILGALRPTPTKKLEVEANLVPLSIRRRQLLLQYGTRMATIKNHPIATFVSSHQPVPANLHDIYIFPVLELLIAEMKFANIERSLPPSLPMTQRYRYTNYPIYSTLAKSCKTNLTNSQWRAQYFDLVGNKYPTHTLVFTDGSLTANSVGCGVWSSQFSLMARLPLHSSIFTAELYGIYSAMKFFSTKTGKFLILTDSLSAIQALQNLSFSSHFLVSWITMSFLPNMPSKFTLEWIPSHVGILGNEKADNLANKSRSLSRLTKLPMSREEMKNHINRIYLEVWKNMWSNTDQSLTCFKPYIDETAFSDAPRPLQVALTRMRLGVTQLSHGHHFRGTPKKLCGTCNTDFSPRHLLIDCPEFTQYRREILRHCNCLKKPVETAFLLSPVFPVDILGEFLRDTGLRTEL